MKTNVKKGLLTSMILAFMLALVIQSCRKEEAERSNSLVLKSMNDDYLSERMFSDVQIDSLGKMHNELLSLCYKSFDFSSDNFSTEFDKQFKKYQDIYGIKLENLEHRTDLNEMKNRFQKQLSPNANLVIKQIETVARSTFTVIELTNKINRIEASIREQFVGKELDILLSISTVIKSSAYFWYPEEYGGSGEGFSIIQKFESINDQSGKTTHIKEVVTEALITDGFSAGTGSLGVAVVGILGGPVGWAALVIVFGESVLSSGFTAWREYNNP